LILRSAFELASQFSKRAGRVCSPHRALFNAWRQGEYNAVSKTSHENKQQLKIL